MKGATTCLCGPLSLKATVALRPPAKADTGNATFISILLVGDLLQVDEVGCQSYVVHATLIPHLDFDPPAQGREHFLEDHLLMPHGVSTILLHRGSPLK